MSKVDAWMAYIYRLGATGTGSSELSWLLLAYVPCAWKLPQMGRWYMLKLQKRAESCNSLQPQGKNCGRV